MLQKCVLSGNTQWGLYIYGSGATGNTVENCYIGANAAGTAAIGNGSGGLGLYAPNNTVGGTSTAARCIISGNTGCGIYIDSNSGAVTATGNTIQGCFLGTNAAGTSAIANSIAGIYISTASNIVGGAATGAGCLLSGNTSYGLYFNGAVGNVVQGCYCGTSATGTSAIANGLYGIYVHGGSSSQIGGTATGAGCLVSGNASSGIYMDNSATSTQVQGNLIGVTLAGSAALANGASGILINGCNSNTIGGTATGARNVASGNTVDGIQLTGAASTNTVQGNVCGLNQAGSAAIPNGGQGIDINGGTNNIIGGSAAGAGNLCSGNTAVGIYIQATSTGNIVQGNICGLNAAGASAIGNGSSGITTELSGANSNTIGGTASGAGNVVSGNGHWGINLDGGSSNTVQGNYVGTNSAGSSAIANVQGGVRIAQSGANNVIGGSTASARNIVSGNLIAGIIFSGTGTGNFVQGNYIGLNAAGTAGIANTIGVSITTSSTNTIGGTSAGQGNIIAFNTNQGVDVVSGAGNAIEGNSVYSNGSLGIDLGGDGVTANNGTENGALPNCGMDFPILTVATLNGTTFSVVGYVGSAVNQSTFASARVELFKSSNDASGYGEGKTYLGFLTSNASGNLCGSITVSGLAAGDNVTATATDASGNTSEFGPNFTVAVPRTPFDYAAVINSSFSNTKLITGSAGTNGDIYSNGNLSLTSTSAVNGNALASGTVSASLITGVQGTPFPAPTMNTLDIANYTSIANMYYSTAQTFSGTTWSFGSGTYTVIVVNGDITLNGNFTITGSVTVVANGKITINGNLVAGIPSSKLAFLANNGITVTGGSTVDGWLYTHNAGNTANLGVSVAATVTGGITGDTMTITNSAQSIYDPAMNAALGHNMHLPGY